jgi:hypothetical protein
MMRGREAGFRSVQFCLLARAQPACTFSAVVYSGLAHRRSSTSRHKTWLNGLEQRLRLLLRISSEKFGIFWTRQAPQKGTEQRKNTYMRAWGEAHSGG